MGIGLRALVLATSLFALPAFAADQQFDLICTSPNGSAHYRVDLDRGEVCEGSCERIWKIASVTSGELTLTDKTPAFKGDTEERSSVNRATGKWKSFTLFDGTPYIHEGACKVAPFTGFPTAKF